MSKKSLYNINSEQLELISKIELAEGELTPEMEKLLEINESNKNQKVVAYLEVVKNREGLNILVDAEIKRLQSLKKSNNNLISRLKETLLTAVRIFGGFSIGLQKFSTIKSTSISVFDVNSLPAKYKNIKVTETANKTELKKALLSGKKIKGVKLNNNINLKIN